MQVFDTLTVAYFTFAISFFWRGAIGVGSFNNAKLMCQYRQLFLSEKVYCSITGSLGDKKYVNALKNKHWLYVAAVVLHYVATLIVLAFLANYVFLISQDPSGNIASIYYSDWINILGIVAIFFIILFVAHMPIERFVEIETLIKKIEFDIEDGLKCLSASNTNG